MRHLSTRLFATLPFLKRDPNLIQICYEVDNHTHSITILTPYKIKKGIKAIYFILNQPQKFTAKMITNDPNNSIDIQDDSYYQIVEPYTKLTRTTIDDFAKNNLHMYSFVEYPEDLLNTGTTDIHEVSIKLMFHDHKENQILAVIQPIS